jgi:hypothetical protein
MTNASATLESLIEQVNANNESVPVLDRLERAVELADRLGELSENLVGYFVDESRRAGESWAEIGERLGVSRQAAQKRFIVADGESDRFWDRTSKGFKSVIDLAEAAAQARNQGFLGTEHVLLAMSDRPRDPATAVLTSIGIDPKVLRGAVDGRIGSPADLPGSAEAPFTAKMLRALQLAKREAMRMESEEIDTVHLALALLAMEEGMAFEILSNLGATYDGVLEAVLIASHR